MIIGLEHASTARSHSRSGSRSPAFAKPMMALRDCLARWVDHAPVIGRAWMAVSNAMPKRRVVSGIEPLPIQILSDRHGENRNAPSRRGLQHGCQQGTLVGRGIVPKNPKNRCIFSRKGGEQDFAMVSLIAYECSACGYGTSMILPAGKQTNDEGQGLDAADISTDQGLRQRKALMVLAAEYWEPGASLAVISSQKKGSRPSDWPAVPILRGCPLRRPMFPCLRLLAEPAAAVPAAVR